MLPEPEQIVDLARYPISDPADDGYAELAARLRAELDQQQYCVMSGFLADEACSRLVAEVEAVLPRAYPNRSRRNCYLQRAGDPSRPADHPGNMLFDASYRMLAYDLFGETSLLRALYQWAPFRTFVAAVVGADELFASEDPYQPANVLCYGAGDNSAWHFDSTNAFTMTLMLQAAESGGEFEIAPYTRRVPLLDPDPEEARLAAILSGDRADVVTVPREPGALVIFRGCTSVHRVTEVRGDTDRLMAVMVYEDRPGVTGDPEVNRTVYGPRTGASAPG